MIAFLNRNDLDNLRLAIHKMKSENFDAAGKMDLLLEAYEKQTEDDSELERLKEAIEDLPGWGGSKHASHVELTASMLERAAENVLEWSDSKDEEPLDEAVKRIVAVADGPNEKAKKLEKVLSLIVAVVDRGESDALVEVRSLAVDAL